MALLRDFMEQRASDRLEVAPGTDFGLIYVRARKGTESTTFDRFVRALEVFLSPLLGRERFGAGGSLDVDQVVSNVGMAFDSEAALELDLEPAEGMATLQVRSLYGQDHPEVIEETYDLRYSRITDSGGYTLHLRVQGVHQDQELTPGGREPNVCGEHLYVAATDLVDAQWLKAHEDVAALDAHLREGCEYFVPGGPLGAIADLGPRWLRTLKAGVRMTRQLDAVAQQLVDSERECAALKGQREGDSKTIDALRASIERKDRQLRERASTPGAATESIARQDTETGTGLRLLKLEEQLDASRVKLEQQAGQNDAMRQEIYELQQQLYALRLRPVVADEQRTPIIPSTFAELAEWSKSELRGRVVLHPKALASAAESNYQNPAKAYEALLALADLYWPMLYEEGYSGQRDWEQRCAELGIECSPIGTANTTARTASAYELVQDGQRLVMTMHLRGNSSFDPRFGLRIYWARDDRNRRLVVGALPTHLPNRESN